MGNSGIKCGHCGEHVTSTWLVDTDTGDMYVCEECFNDITGQYPPEERPIEMG